MIRRQMRRGRGSPSHFGFKLLTPFELQQARDAADGRNLVA